MKRWLFLWVLLAYGTALAQPATLVLVQDFEGAKVPLKVWVVNIPNDNASVKLATEHPHQGQQSLNLNYHFTGSGQYLGVPLPVNILVPVHKVRWMLYGDGSGCGYALHVSDASNETHKYRDAATMNINWKDWKEISIDLNAPHETWGGEEPGD